MTGAYEYARALFMISEEEHCSDKMRDDVEILRDSFLKNPDYARLIDTPALPKEKRLELIDEAFSSLNPSLVNLIKILSEMRLSYLLPKLAEEYFLFRVERVNDKVEHFLDLGLEQMIFLFHFSFLFVRLFTNKNSHL